MNERGREREKMRVKNKEIFNKRTKEKERLGKR